MLFDSHQRGQIVDRFWLMYELNIFLSACTPEELYKAFCEDMVWLREEYGRCDDKDLSEDGIRLKQEILDLVESEDPFYPQITQIGADLISRAEAQRRKGTDVRGPMSEVGSQRSGARGA